MLPLAKCHTYVLIFYAGIPIDRLFVLQTVNNLISNLETYGIVVKTIVVQVLTIIYVQQLLNPFYHLKTH